MMKKNILLVLGAIVGVVLLLLGSLFLMKDRPASKGDDFVKTNYHIESFTSGYVSRKASVYVVLADAVSSDKFNKIDLNDVMSIYPSVKGNFSFVDNKTIAFRPETAMDYDTKYEVKIDLDELYDDDSEEFIFVFKTMPFGLVASQQAFNVSETGDYEYEVLFRTRDDESLELLESIVKVEQVPGIISTEWSYLSGTEHLLKILLKPEKKDEISISTVENSELKLEEEELLVLDVPNPSELSVLNVEYLGYSMKCIEVTFNKNLDEKQSMKGLVFIEEEKDADDAKAPLVSNNKIKIYLSKKHKGKVKLFLSRDIRSKEGNILGESKEFEVEITMEQPDVCFIGNGVIYPQSDKLIVPFKAVGLRGVKVRVFKIYSNNVDKMLCGVSNVNVSLVGRPVAVTTFYMDGSDDELSSWRNYAIDLTNLVKLDPGCMYRIELFPDFRLTAWPGADVPKIDKQSMENEDKLLFAELNDVFDHGSYYMSSYERFESEYRYSDREDPCTPTYYMYKGIGREIIASNIGLVAYSPSNGKLTVIATDILSAKALSGADIEVFNRQGQIVAKSTTDSEGRIDFELDNNNGAPNYVIARTGNDMCGISVKRGEELSTSTFDVSGEVIQKGLKGYIYGERGVWRPGDTLFLSFMLNDRENRLPDNHPVTMELSNPLGQMYKKMTLTDGNCGLYSFVVPTEATVPTGSWLMNVKVGGTVFSKRLRIETVKPNRLKIDAKLPDLLEHDFAGYRLHTEWLNGSKAKNLKYEVDVKLNKSTTTFSKYEGYRFDKYSSDFSTMELATTKGVVDMDGNANVPLNISVNKEAPGMLRCELTTRVYEESGEFSSDVQTVKYSPYSRYVGIKAPSAESKGYLDTGKNHKYEVVLVDENGAPKSGTLDVDLVKVSWSWWWNSYEDELSYSSSEKSKVMKRLKVNVNASGKGSFSVNIPDKDWGCYEICVTDSNGGKHTTSLLSYFDWPYLSSPRSSEKRENAVTLSVSADKKEYEVGDVAKIMFPSVDGGRAIVSICNSSGILSMKTIDCKGLSTTESFEITKGMMPNSYVVVTFVQPYMNSKNDMPIRLYGVAPIRVTSKESKLNPVISSKDEFKPLTKCEVRVKEESGRKMAYTLAIVDEGLLDLTHFKTPDAWSAFNAKEALGLRMWDLYGKICGAFGGRIDQTFSVGGDEGIDRGKSAKLNRFTPVVYYKGPFTLEKGDENKHVFDMPNYSGRVRVMVVATDGEAYGSADKSVMVRKPLMVVGTMPRQIGANEEMTVAATIFAMDKSVKNVKTTLRCSGNMEVVGPKDKTVSFSEIGDQTVQFKVKTGAKGGKGTVSILCSSGGESSSYETDIDIRVVTNHLVKVEHFTLNAGENKNFNLKPIGTENQKVRVEVSKVKPLNVSRRANDLIEYPHGCAEQITSRGFAQLNLMDFAKLSESQKSQVSTNVNAVIKKLASYQTGDGGMAYWPGGSYPNRWVSSYILMFLHKAENKGFFVSYEMKKRLADYTKNTVRLWKPGSDVQDSYDAAFALYVLATVNKAEQGTMNRMKESVSSLSSTARNLLAASYAVVGQQKVAQQLLKVPVKAKLSYSWCSEEHSALIAYSLAGDVRADESSEVIRERLVSNVWMSTADAALSLWGMDLYLKRNKSSESLNFTLTSNNKEHASVKSDEELSWSGELPSGSFSVSNKGKGVLHIVATLEGDVLQGDVAELSNGLSVDVSYLQEDKPVSLDELTQGDVLKAVVTVTNTSGRDLENIALTHVLPSGFETLSATRQSYDDYQDLRDDRVLSYFNKLKKNTSVKVTLNLSATYSGVFYLPAITAEAMYDNKVFGSTKSGACTVK